MYAYLKGTLVAINPTYVIVDVQGIGYTISISCRGLSELPTIGEIVHLYTSFIVRELSHALYGFTSEHERDLFDLFLTISGVGPKLALSLIGHLSIDELQSAMGRQDVTLLCKVPGIGKKTAERLIVELKDKLPGMPSPLLSNIAIHLPLDPNTQKIQDAILALINLGYNQNTAQKAVKQSLKDLPETADLALLITSSLKNI
jgi:Holliday junction DNA helicase RuvA